MIAQAEPFRDRIALVLLERFPELVDVDYGRAKAPGRLPYAGILLDGIDREMHGVRSVRENYRFAVTLRFPMPDRAEAETLKAELGRRLAEGLIAEDWNEVGGFLPMVTGIGFAEADEQDAPTLDVDVAFSVSADVFQ